MVKDLGRHTFLLLAAPTLLLTGCGQPPTDRELLETLLTFELCDNVSAVNVTRDEDVSGFRFDEVYRFQLSGTPECLSEIIEGSKAVFLCKEYPDQLSCEDTKGNSATFNFRQDKIDFTYAT